jgi:predicted enzyme related to lactoylglutathione lyase
MVYLNAEPSIDAALERVRKAGGEIVLPKTALPPGLGFFAHVLDSEGNRIGFHAQQ